VMSEALYGRVVATATDPIFLLTGLHERRSC
jgi:hypothetical protein